MNLKYLFRPKNPRLYHCSESFYKAMTSNSEFRRGDDCVDYLYSVNFYNIWLLINKLFNLNPEDKISLFLFSIQSDYLFLTLILKIISRFDNKKIKIYYLMHEPRFEKGRINPFKANLVFIYHLFFSYLADKIFLPSDEAFLKAKSFIDTKKIYKLNLSFISPSENDLQKNLEQLKCSWNDAKTFSLLGRADIDKNPQGFLDLANIIQKYYPDKARFIRGGSERNVNVTYDEELIIRFPGFISSSAKKFLFSLTHFIVIPYSFSTQSGVATEALSYGKLLIVNDIPTFSYLKELNFVFLVDFNDKNAILKCLHHLFSMNINDYEKRYWEAVKYFQNNHSETYLSKALNDALST